MAEYPLVNDVQAAKAEINSTITSMFQGAYLIGALIIISHILSHRNDASELRRVMLTLGASLTFLIAEHKHKISRLGAWVRWIEQVEEGQKFQSPVIGWETWKARLKSKFVIMPICGLGMATAPLYVVVRELGWLTLSEPGFTIASVGLIVIGVIMIWIGQELADW